MTLICKAVLYITLFSELGKLGLRVIKLLFANAKLEQNTSVKTNLQKNLRILYPWLNKIFKDNFI